MNIQLYTSSGRGRRSLHVLLPRRTETSAGVGTLQIHKKWTMVEIDLLIIFSLNRPTGPILSLGATFSMFFLRLITPIYKYWKSNRSIANRFLREKLRKDNGFRFNNFGSEMVRNFCAIFFLIFGLYHTLLIDLGHDQQQHPAVYSGGVSRGMVRGCGCWR